MNKLTTRATTKFLENPSKMKVHSQIRVTKNQLLGVFGLSQLPHCWIVSNGNYTFRIVKTAYDAVFDIEGPDQRQTLKLKELVKFKIKQNA
jgi:hypothetical protein